MSHAARAYPHEGGCRGCWRDQRCNVCGKPLTRRVLCTNGRCHYCHVEICTPGGDDTLGHGYGSQARARALVARLQKAAR
jgi:hypothetical protein